MPKRIFALCAVVVLMCAAAAGRSQEAAELDILRVVLGQPGTWSASAPALGEKAGIFRRHGLALEIVGVPAGGRPGHVVMSGSADLGVGIATAPVLRAYAKGAPIRVIGANFTGASDLYWYVRADSPIKRLDDVSDDTTIGFSAAGSPSHHVVLGFIQELRLKGLPTASGTETATLAQVMLGRIDVGWAAAPFGLQEMADGKIRILANGNHVPSLRTQTVRVDVVNANTLRARHDAIMRFVRAYRETLDWMFSSPQAVEMFAAEFKVGPELASITREKFQTREAMRNDRLSDLDAVMADAVALKFIDRQLSKEEVADLVRIPPQ
jgi:NitT/TauT family transport system substrate-binding protein